MDNKDRSVFDRLDSIENNQEEILKSLNKLNNTSKLNAQVNNKQTSNNETLKSFIKKSKKEYLFFGNNIEFTNNKKKAIISCLGLIIIGFISTICTSIAFGMYSTFSLFENILVIQTCITIFHIQNCKKIMSDEDLKNNHFISYKLDSYNTWSSTGKEKVGYKIIRILCYISIISNIIIIWVQSNGALAVAATLFEIIFLALIIVNRFLKINFYCMYDTIIFFTGYNSNNESIKLVGDMFLNKIYSYNDFLEKFGKGLDL